MEDKIRTLRYLACFLIILGSNGCAPSPSIPCPTDKDLIDRFSSQEAAFAKLASDPDNVQLLPNLGIKRVIKRSGTLIWFEVWFKDFPGPGGCMKGYAYCGEPPSSTVESIDSIASPGSPETKEIYRKISGNWYLFYQSSN
jgi:hypothetical protein